MREIAFRICAGLVLFGLTVSAEAQDTGLAVGGPVKSGNELARKFVAASKERKKAMQKEAVGKLFLFRYLKVQTRETSTNSPTIAFRTLEPGSDMYIEFKVGKTESLKLADTLAVDDCVALSGRLREIGGARDENLIVLDPVVLRYKDHAKPVLGKEYLYEVDPTARKGTDTSSGKEVIIKK